jgi:hypothetical protein
MTKSEEQWQAELDAAAEEIKRLTSCVYQLQSDAMSLRSSWMIADLSAGVMKPLLTVEQMVQYEARIKEICEGMLFSERSSPSVPQ